MGAQMKTASEVRKEAADIARSAAKERESTGDPEGADVIREIVRDILAIQIRSTRK
jgi:hypothetical protein